jgi:hypothetical protein
MKRDDRLPGPDLALEESLHGDGAVEVGVELGRGAHLVRRERERERRLVARHELTRRAQRLCRGALARGRRSSERQPEDEQLVEGETDASDLGLGQRARAMDRMERVRSKREAFRGEQLRRKIVANGTNTLERLQVQVTKLLLGEVLGGRVDRCEVSRLGLAVQIVRRDGEAELVRTAADPDLGARDELPLEPRLVEPRRLDLARRRRPAR